LAVIASSAQPAGAAGASPMMPAAMRITGQPRSPAIVMPSNR
jgi:hypothetical protein